MNSFPSVIYLPYIPCIYITHRPALIALASYDFSRVFLPLSGWRAAISAKYFSAGNPRSAFYTHILLYISFLSLFLRGDGDIQGSSEIGDTYGFTIA